MNNPIKDLEDYSFIALGAEVAFINENILIRGTITDVPHSDISDETEITVHTKTCKYPFSYVVKAKDVYSIHITDKEKSFIYKFIGDYESGKYVDINLLVSYLKYNYNIDIRFDIVEYSMNNRHGIFKCGYKNKMFKDIFASIVNSNNETNTFDNYYKSYKTAILMCIHSSIEFITENKISRKFPRLSFINIITPVRYGS